jgi:hypothetical protein
MANTYDVGDGIRLKAQFKVTGSFVDPTIIDLEVRDPLGNIEYYYYASGTISKEAVGRYFTDIFVGLSGQWWYRYASTGTVLASDEQYLIVERSVFA